MRRQEEAQGFSLVETLIATTIMVVALSALAHLFVAAGAASQGARSTTLATMLAREKMEELNGLGEHLGPVSPEPTLDQNIDGYCDFRDARGRRLAAGAVPPVGTKYVVRWSIDPLPADSNDTRVLQVRVLRWPVAANGASGEARLVAVIARRARGGQ